MSSCVYDLYGVCIQTSVSFLCDPKGTGPGRACDACSVRRCSLYLLRIVLYCILLSTFIGGYTDDKVINYCTPQ
jgi:hypothetical protein